MPKNTPDVDHTCSFCGKPQSAVNKLIAGPGVMICAECVARCMQIAPARSRDVLSTAGLLVQAPKGPGVFSLFFSKMRAGRLVEPRCSFCGKAAPDLVQPPSTLGSRALICRECLALCQDIIEERLGKPPQ